MIPQLFWKAVNETFGRWSLTRGSEPLQWALCQYLLDTKISSLVLTRDLPRIIQFIFRNQASLVSVHDPGGARCGPGQKSVSLRQGRKEGRNSRRKDRKKEGRGKEGGREGGS